ncbi:MAG TPA: benzoate-CoA ligase family protein, partial [Pirellulales bacterium]|nr:benzoate-CoA ligase family protein [Pirellulales bacterium]
PAPGCEIRLMDDELREVPTGAEGVLCVRRSTHPGMMKEYWNKPEQTAEIFRGEWYYSGDVLVKDEQGLFWFKGRSDDVIKASGYRISPFEVESCLVEHPAVLEAAAVASPDELRGCVVKAFVVLRSERQACDELARELQEWVKEHSAPYKHPRKVEFVAELPKTASGKIKRGLLRAREFG